MPDYWCECYRCGGNPVSKVTWYRHKKETERCATGHPYMAAGARPRAQRHRPNTPSSPPPVDVKEESSDNIDLQDTRTVRSDLDASITH